MILLKLCNLNCPSTKSVYTIQVPLVQQYFELYES